MQHTSIQRIIRQWYALDRLRRSSELSLETIRTSGLRVFWKLAVEKLASIRQQAAGPGVDVTPFLGTLPPVQRALFIEARMITPDKDSGSHRLLRLMTLFKKLDYEVVFVPADLQFEAKYVHLLEDCGILIPHQAQLPSLEAFLAWFGSQFGIVVISRADLADWVLPCARNWMSEALLVFDTVDLHFLREQREAQIRGHRESRQAARKRQQRELDLMQQADVTWVVSQVEARLLHELVPELNVHVVSNIHSVQPETNGYDKRDGILFVGGFEHAPNVDAVKYFAKEIEPLIRTALPGAVTHIVGSAPPDEIRRLASDTIRIHGYVEDLAPYLDDCRISIAPLRYGAGVKGKVNLSMCYGLPVVATPVAAEGAHLMDGRDVLIASDPGRFAEQMVRLYEDPELWRDISDNGKRNIRKYFSPEAALEALETSIMKNRATVKSPSTERNSRPR